MAFVQIILVIFTNWVTRSIVVVALDDRPVSYEGYKVFEIRPKSLEEVEFLYDLKRHSKYYDLDFWKLDKFVNSEARVMVPPSAELELINALRANNIAFDELISDVGSTISDSDDDYVSTYDTLDGGLSFSRYLRHDEINHYLDYLAKKYPQKVLVNTVGHSHEGRDLKTITILPYSNVSHPSTIFIDAAIHAREWIAPATALYAIHQLVEGGSGSRKKGKYDYLLGNVQWIFLPVVNPDGYEYSHKKDRFWRKTRRKAGSCIGVDGNRNYDFQWGAPGASKNSCSQTYRGDEPFSEPETRVVRDIMKSLGDSCKMYLSLHSYGKYFLYPYGHSTKLPETWRELDDVSRAGAEAIRQFSGTKYKIGSSRNVLYAASGLSNDYAFEVMKIPIALTMELPGGGRLGFDPPASSIEKYAKESWEGIKSMAIRISEKFAVNAPNQAEDYHGYYEFDSDYEWRR